LLTQYLRSVLGKCDTLQFKNYDIEEVFYNGTTSCPTVDNWNDFIIVLRTGNITNINGCVSKLDDSEFMYKSRDCFNNHIEYILRPLIAIGLYLLLICLLYLFYIKEILFNSWCPSTTEMVLYRDIEDANINSIHDV